MQWLIFCLLVCTAMLVYFPLVFIRKMNKVLATLERIERNTAPAGASTAAAGK